ncbi:MAG: class I mannose-6-phosphate isomerase [Planctomycetes bacterium]|nr:class I mannose-6-phosphate isomerase [Planctomycetota bacterium]
MDLHPLCFHGLPQEKLWGGDRLRRVAGRSVPPGARIGESWEVVDRPREQSVVAAGPLAGRTLGEILDSARRPLLGEDLFYRFDARFPLLVKLIDAGQPLSVQVHPPDEFARRCETEPCGKSEAWLVLEAEPAARIYRGVLPGVRPADLIEALRAGELREVLYSFEARPGEVVYIPPGTVHTAGPGVLLLEIQQNSDVTYRLHDWDRVDGAGRTRALDLEKGLAVVDFRGAAHTRIRPRREVAGRARRDLLLRTPWFELERIAAHRPAPLATEGRRFHLLSVVSGAGALTWSGGPPVPLTFGATVLVPACIESYVVEPDPALGLLLTTIP